MAYYGSGVIPTSHDSQFYKNSVRNGGTTKFHRGGSWTTFLQKVWTRCEADGLQNGEVSIDEIFQRGFEYFKHVQSSTLSETVVQFGVVAWEQCSNLNAELLPLKSVIDNTVSAGFRSMHFRRFDKLGRNRVDFVARLLTSSDSPPSLVPLGKSPVPLSPASTSALPVWRNSPMNTVAVVSLLTEPKFDVDAAVCQVAHFCECPLRVTPNRKVVFGVATNFQVCVFVAVVVTGEGSYRKYRTYHSSLIEKDVPEQLARFAATSPEALGVTWRFPTSLFEPTQFLGRGSTSWAMSGIWRRQQLVMKLSVQPAAIEVERQLLAYLHSCEDVQLSASIPQIHAEAQAELYPLCQQACSVFTERSDASIF